MKTSSVLFTLIVNKTNVTVITQLESLNRVKFFKEGDFVFEYKDIKIDENTFTRSLRDKKFTF